MTIHPRGTRQHTPAEELPGSTFHVYGDTENQEAAAFTGTQRRRPAAFLTHDPQRGHIDTIYVSPQFRGKGLADRMYHAAGNPAPSPQLTEQGEGWSRRMTAKTGQAMPTTINREEPLNETGHQLMLPDFAGWIKDSPTSRRVQ